MFNLTQVRNLAIAIISLLLVNSASARIGVGDGGGTGALVAQCKFVSTDAEYTGLSLAVTKNFRIVVVFDQHAC